MPKDKKNHKPKGANSSAAENRQRKAGSAQRVTQRPSSGSSHQLQSNGDFGSIRFESAAELVDYLRLSKPHWSPISGQGSSWVFRGHGDASWALLPSAFRKPGLQKLSSYWNQDHVRSYVDEHADKLTVFAGFTMQGGYFGELKGVSPEIGRQLLEQSVAEIAAVKQFASMADSIGVNVGDDDLEPHWLENGPRTAAGRLGSILVDGSMVQPNGLIALAQHHGVPTRLLDWTRNPLIAAFFAAEAAVFMPDERGLPDEMCVWALNGSRLRKPNWTILRYPMASNVFMRSQMGVFSFDPMSDVYYAWHGRRVPLEEQMKNHVFPSNDVLIKLLLPAEEADSLLRLLWDEHVSRLHLMPTLDNVMRSLEVRWRWGWRWRDLGTD